MRAGAVKLRSWGIHRKTSLLGKMDSLSGMFGVREILCSNYGRQKRNSMSPFWMVGEEKSKVGKWEKEPPRNWKENLHITKTRCWMTFIMERYHFDETWTERIFFWGLIYIFFLFSFQCISVDAWFCMVSIFVSLKNKTGSAWHTWMQVVSHVTFVRAMTIARPSLIRTGGIWGLTLSWCFMI